MMGVSSNFGNMFSAAGGSVFLPFLPMLPIQILLNNLLYDTSQTVMTTDNVDAEYIEKPKRWDISFIRRFMIIIGPVSSLFDYVTFFTMLFIFNAWTNAALFQTAWFIESLCSQTLVVLIIRTKKGAFLQEQTKQISRNDALSSHQLCHNSAIHASRGVLWFCAASTCILLSFGRDFRCLCRA